MYPLGSRLPNTTPVGLDLADTKCIKRERRTVIWRTALADGRAVAVKMYRRGRFDRYRGLLAGFRVEREFDGLSHLEALGIPCSPPVFWSHGHFGSYGWCEMVVTEWVDQSQTLKELLPRLSNGDTPDLSPLFRDLAKMHSAGVHHGMLRIRNVLIRNYPDNPTFVLIDMPRFHRFPGDIRGSRMAHYDLKCLCEGLFPYFSDDVPLSWLSAYGIAQSESMDLLANLKKFRSTSSVRKFAVAEFDTRNRIMRLLRPLRRER